MHHRELGYTMSRSYVYYRLMPKRKNTTEAKKHINSVPVRLARASNDSHKSHKDTKFCAATIRRLDEVASFLGPEDVARLSQDDKARVPLGVTAATHQSPILMHMEYRVRLPDHDWVVAEKHKLIPSVYAGTIFSFYFENNHLLDNANYRLGHKKRMDLGIRIRSPLRVQHLLPSVLPSIQDLLHMLMQWISNVCFKFLLLIQS